MDGHKAELAMNYMRYSKRIVVVALISWIAVAALIMGLLYYVSITNSVLDEFVASVLKTMMTAASGVAIACSGGYYAHSTLEESMKKTIREETTQCGAG